LIGKKKGGRDRVTKPFFIYFLEIKKNQFIYFHFSKEIKKKRKEVEEEDSDRDRVVVETRQIILQDVTHSRFECQPKKSSDNIFWRRRNSTTTTRAQHALCYRFFLYPFDNFHLSDFFFQLGRYFYLVQTVAANFKCREIEQPVD
jgi:hypothetical protein